jgi:hypothetical protein
VSSFVTELSVGIDKREIRLSADSEHPMYSRMQFAALELMCRERAALARREMEYSLAEYWLAEAEEWKEFADLCYPFIEKNIASHSSDLAEANSHHAKGVVATSGRAAVTSQLISALRRKRPDCCAHTK